MTKSRPLSDPAILRRALPDLATGAADTGFNFQISLWLWFTVLFAYFAEAMAEARGKAQADSQRKTKTHSVAKRLLPNGKTEEVAASQRRAGDHVICETGDTIPGDGEVVDGIATVDESVITGGTRGLSGRNQIRITSNPGETFLERMIALAEGADRKKTPNEIELNMLIGGLTLIFLLAVVKLQPISAYSGAPPSVAVLVSPGTFR